MEIRKQDEATWNWMAAHMRRMIAKNDGTPLGMNPDLDEARAIVALLPEPCGDDLVEARKVATENSNWVPGSGHWQSVLDGKQDHIPMVKTALAAIKRGREMAARDA